MDIPNRYVINSRIKLNFQVQFDKISERLRTLTNRTPILSSVDHILIAQKVVSGVYNGVSTKELDILAAETAAHMSTKHPG